MIAVAFLRRSAAMRARSARSSRRARSKRLPARRVSPSRARIAATRASRASRSGASSSRVVSVVPSGLRTRTGTGDGSAATATTSSAGTRPPSRSRTLARIASRSSSVSRSFLLSATINRLPSRAISPTMPLIGPRHVVIDDENEQIGPQRQLHGLRLAGAAALAGLAERGRVGQEQRAFHALDGVRVGPAVRGRPHRRPGLAGAPAEQRIHQRGLADRPGAQHDDVKAMGLVPARGFGRPASSCHRAAPP